MNQSDRTKEKTRTSNPLCIPENTLFSALVRMQSSRETSTSNQIKMVVNVQNKLRLALGSVKDHASIGKAMIYNRDGLSSIDIAVLRATGHDNTPIDDKHMHEILFLVSNSPAAAGCSSIPYLSQTISHRLHKTRDRFVALKTLMLVHRLLRGGDRKFEEGLRKAHLTGHLQMNTEYWFSTDRNSSSSSSDNSLRFLRSYADFLEERMGWIINQAGKLEPILCQGLEFHFHEEKSIEMVFQRLPKFQLFLGKVLNCSSAILEMSSPSDDCLLIVRAAIRNILRESFQVYMNFCEGVATLSDSFFDFKDPARVLALQLLKEASKQSYQLCDFFENCKRNIGTKHLDYPFVQIITSDHVSSLMQFLDNHSTTTSCSSSLHSTTHNPCNSPNSVPSPIYGHFKRPNAKLEATLGGEIIEETEVDTAAVGTSFAVFSCKLETKISTVWVEFDK